MQLSSFLFFAIPVIVGLIATAVLTRLTENLDAKEDAKAKRRSSQERAGDLADAAAPKAKRSKAPEKREATQATPVTAPPVNEPSLQALAVDGVPEVINLAEFSNRNVSAAA